MVALIDEGGAVLLKPTPFAEQAAGYRRLGELLGAPDDCLVAIEATGHYWRNLFLPRERGFRGGVAQSDTWYVCVNGCCRTSATGCANFIALWA